VGFDEDRHPRDENGRFTGGALGAWVGSKISSKKFTDERPAGMKAETWQEHYDKNPNDGGKPSEKRLKEVQEPIMREALNKVSPVKPDEQKMAIFTMGGPGSGKSSILEKIDKSRFVKVDPDDVRVKLPEYQKATSGGKVFRGAAAMTHEEASDIAKHIIERAIAENKHIIIDGTGKTASSMIAKMKRLKDEGYHVHLMFAHAPVDEGLQRVAKRGQETGRFVPEQLVKDAYATIPKNFAAISKAADSWQVFDTSKAGMGSGPTWEKTPAGDTIEHDRGFVRTFKAEHGGSKS